MLERLFSKTWRQGVQAELRAGPRALRHTVPLALKTRFGRVNSLVDVALRNARQNPDALALEMGDERFTWSSLADACSRVAHVLQDAGVRQGDVVAVLGLNSPFYVALLLGCTRAGATAALINTNLRGRQLAHAVRVSGAKVAVVEGVLEAPFRTSDGHDDLRRVLVYGGGPMDAALASAPAQPFPPSPVSAADDFVYIYTSGTTGLPKPCRVSHARALLAGASAGPLMYEFRPGDKVYCVLPLYHASGLLLGVGASMIAKVPVALRASFSASQFWPDVRRYNATAVIYIGELCRYLVNSPERPDDDDNPVRVAVGNGLRPDVWPHFQKRFSIPNIREFYAATEAPGMIANLSGREGSVGRVPFGGYGVLRLVQYDVATDTHPRNSDGFCILCADGQAGELLIRIPETASPGLEYRGYTDEAATHKKVLRNVFKHGDAFFRSGDLLRRDSEGFFYFVDRIGDTYRWKGENVSTAEVADEISQSPAFLEAAVVGVQVPNVEGQTGLAAVVPATDFDPADFGRAVDSLPSYARPLFVRVVGGLDTTGTFKIQKAELRKEGVDPAKVADALFMLHNGQYEPLSPTLWESLLNGEVRV